jgi:ribosomal protein S24E
MTSREEKYLRLLELKKVATEFNLVTYFANKYGMAKYNVYFTLDKDALQQYLTGNNAATFVMKQWFFFMININKDNRFKVTVKLAFGEDFPLAKVKIIDDIEDLRTYIKEYIAYTKRNLEKVKLEKIQWDFND